MAMTINAAIRPYSIAVAPRSSARSMRKIFRIAITPPSSGPRPRGGFTSLPVNNSCRGRVNAPSPLFGGPGGEVQDLEGLDRALVRRRRAEGVNRNLARGSADEKRARSQDVRRAHLPKIGHEPPE